MDTPARNFASFFALHIPKNVEKKSFGLKSCTSHYKAREGSNHRIMCCVESMQNLYRQKSDPHQNVRPVNDVKLAISLKQASSAFPLMSQLCRWSRDDERIVKTRQHNSS
jgi:hypothetical protein